MTATKTGKPRKSATGTRKGIRRLDPRGPWKRSWNVIWASLSLLGEVALIFLVKSSVVHLSILQIVVLFISIPFAAHLLVSAFRSILIAASLEQAMPRTSPSDREQRR
jgi:hypothetical protein